MPLSLEKPYTFPKILVVSRFLIILNSNFVSYFFIRSRNASSNGSICARIGLFRDFTKADFLKLTPLKFAKNFFYG
jgi:hypothetical protein